MFRIPSTLRSRNVSTLFRCRKYSTQHQSSNASGKIVLGAAGVTSLFAGVFGYGAYSNENRKTIEDLIPGFDYIFDTFLGPPQKPLVLPPVDYRPKKKKVVIEPDVPKPIEEPVVNAIEDKPAVEVETIVEPVVENVATDEPTSPPVEEMIIVTPSAEEREANKLSELLMDLKLEVNKSLTAAVTAAELASDAIKEHSELAFKAIDSADEKLFSSIPGYTDKKNELVKAAEDKIEAVTAKIENLKEAIVNAIESGKFKGHHDLLITEESIADYFYNIQNIKNIIAQAVNDGKAVTEYGELVDAGRKQFAEEVRSLTPDVKLGETSEKLTTEELNLLLAHAHRKVINLQRLLAKHQVLEHESFNKAIEHQRKDDLTLLESKIKAELDKQEQILNLQFKQKIESLHDDFEDELRSQLKRQAAAHSDHLSEVLSVQEKELQEKWELKLAEDVQSERDQYHRAVAEMRGHIQGLNTAISQRADIDKQAYAARRLWLACESLKAALKANHAPGKTYEEKLVPLNDHINAIADASGEENQYVKTILSSVPELVKERGVYNESDLKERFKKVDRIAKKCAMIGDNGGSLVKYLLSYLQNMLVVDSFESLPPTEMKDGQVAVDDFNTYDILARVRHCLDKDDLTQAVKYMNLLRGEPRNIASDWIKEARLVLETHLIADALLLHAAATTVTAL